MNIRSTLFAIVGATILLGALVSTHSITEANVGGRVRTGAECFGAEGTFTSDQGSITASNSATRISIRLI
jgi:hypothetical protein